MKSQDIVLLLKLVALHSTDFLEDIAESRFSVRSLEAETGISKSQISLSLKRMYDVGLAK